MTKPHQIHPGHLAAQPRLSPPVKEVIRNTSSTPPADVGSSQWHSTPQLRPPRKTPGTASPARSASRNPVPDPPGTQPSTHVHMHLNSGSRPPIGYRDLQRAHLVLLPSCSCSQTSGIPAWIICEELAIIGLCSHSMRMTMPAAGLETTRRWRSSVVRFRRPGASKSSPSVLAYETRSRICAQAIRWWSGDSTG